ncbi:MAG: transposase [Actinomycetota bacterium]|nr:transposase [Actinomycetota bacterium]
MEFQERFTTDAVCLGYLAASRWPEGFICPGCGGHRAWVLERRHPWECSASTSSSSATTHEAPRWPLSKPSSGSAQSTIRRPMTRSPHSGKQPEPTGYASAS